MLKKLISIVLCLALMIVPFSNAVPFVTAAAASAPIVSVNIEPYATIHPNTTVTVTYTARADAALSTCDTRLEGESLGTGATVSFTPSAKGITQGLHTLIMEATDANGNRVIDSLTFNVSADAPVDAAASLTTTVFEADALGFTAGYGSSADGSVDLSTVSTYSAYEQHALQYTDDTTSVSSASGIPYQVFDIDLEGKTSGQVTVAYSGSTKEGERIAVKAYNVKTATWDVLDTFIGSGSVSEVIDIATYNDGGTIHVAAVLDYVANGSNMMIWSTDPQHYTKFEDLHEYYYTIYRYAAEKYQNGEAAYILTTGDLVDDIPSAAVSTRQWGVASQAMSYVEAVGMPNGVITGNHDVNTVSNTDYTSGVGNVDYSKYLATFPASRYNTERWYGGSLNNNTSHYDLVTVGNVDFIILQLGYGVEATDETIAWANEVLRTYRHRTAIVATHQYLDALSANRAGRAELLFNTIVDPNPNVKMVICGHDDGSLCLEKTASDGRTVYEVLADYQFVEAEDPEFYANEHWIGKVPSCCGDGYIRLLTIEGETLNSITYSPVTGRYNPYGDRENLTIDLDCGTPYRTMATARFSAAVLGGVTTNTNVDRVTKTTDGTVSVYAPVTYAFVPAAPAATDSVSWPSTTYGAAATPSNPYYAHAAKEAPLVGNKIDLLETVGLGAHPAVSSSTSVGDYALGLSVDLNKTPYLYYSFAMPAGANFTFAFVNDTNTAPWLTFADASLGGSVFNSTSEKWDSYTAGEQYFTTSATGCIDLRELSVDGASWIVNQLNLYSRMGKDVVLSYMFFGSEPLATTMPDTAYGDPATPVEPFAAHAADTVPSTAYKVDLLEALGRTNNTVITGYTPYSGTMGLQIDLNKTPYLYYSFAMPAESDFTFGLYNDNSNGVPWFTFLDVNKGGSTMNATISNWNAYTNREQYFTTSATGCIDVRKVMADPNVAEWIVNQITFYTATGREIVVQYLFFGSDAMDADAVAGDAEALTALYDRANAIDTSGYTTASVNALKAAIKVVKAVDKTDSDAVAKAYAGLSAAIGGLTVPETTADTTNLVSVKNYSLSNENWVCNSTGEALTSSSSFLDMTQTDDGMILSKSSVATHTWPQARYVGSGDTYTVDPYGGMYLKLDVAANKGWSINLYVTQNDYYSVVRVNFAVDNAFNSNTADGYEGEYRNVYDISEAFRSYGIDPTASFTVNQILLLVVGEGSNTVTFNHVELLTETDPGSVDRTALQQSIDLANSMTSSLYTSATWSAVATALNEANTANSSSSYTQQEVNLAKFYLDNAINALELTAATEADGSLLPSDIGLWSISNTSELSIAKNSSNETVFTNKGGAWPQGTHRLIKPMYVSTRNRQLEINMTVDGAINVLLLVDGEWITVSKYINADRVSGDDLMGGTYIVEIPLNDIAELNGKAGVSIEAVRIYSVAGNAAAPAITLRRFAIDDIPEYTWDLTQSYGPAATPSNPYYAHCAINEPIVAEKVDVLAASGLNRPTVTSAESYGDNRMHLTIDLAKTPYLYYSFQQTAGSNFTFGLYSDNSNGVPWFSFLDASKGGATMNTTVDNWNAYTNKEQYATTSATGCIDMRTLLEDSSVTTWLLNQLTLYNTTYKDVHVSYLFFGSEALSDGNTEVATMAGDVNLDGYFSTLDARYCLKALVESNNPLSAYQFTLADMMPDNVLNTRDVRSMLQALL